METNCTAERLLAGAMALMASDVSAYSPGPAALTAATRNSYGLPSLRPFTVKCVSLISFGVALSTIINFVYGDKVNVMFCFCCLNVNIPLLTF